MLSLLRHLFLCCIYYLEQQATCYTLVFVHCVYVQHSALKGLTIYCQLSLKTFPFVRMSNIKFSNGWPRQFSVILFAKIRLQSFSHKLCTQCLSVLIELRNFRMMNCVLNKHIELSWILQFCANAQLKIKYTAHILSLPLFLSFVLYVFLSLFYAFSLLICISASIMYIQLILCIVSDMQCFRWWIDIQNCIIHSDVYFFADMMADGTLYFPFTRQNNMYTNCTVYSHKPQTKYYHQNRGQVMQ